MHKESVKQSIVDYIRENGSITYSEIEEVMTAAGYDWRGNLTTCSNMNENAVFWAGWSGAAYALIGDLIQSGTIAREPCHVINYLVGGKCLNLPVLERYEDLTTEHWLPCLFVLGKGKS